MDSSSFHKIADEFLENLADSIEDASNDIDAEYLQGVLNIEFKDGKQYVINKHEPTKQIWLSSPFSGASKFTYNENKNSWVKSDGTDLTKLLKDEFKKIGVEV